MKIFILIVMIFLLLCTLVFASQWIKFGKEGEVQFYYDAGSYECYKSFDRRSGKTLGYTATVWIKTSITANGMVIWRLDCSGNKIDKEGHDNPDIYGDHIRPDSIEEKLYNKICSICRSMKYKR